MLLDCSGGADVHGDLVRRINMPYYGINIKEFVDEYIRRIKALEDLHVGMIDKKIALKKKSKRTMKKV